MKKIKVKFLRYKTVLMAEVIDFPTELRGKGLLIADKGNYYKVMSMNYPKLDDGGRTLFLDGIDDKYDQMIALYQYRTDDEAIDAMNAFIKLIEDYNATLAEDTTDCTTVLLDVKIAQ